jgi:methylmalonyl-CoA/ethylmalonyl-CoA epimerase
MVVGMFDGIDHLGIAVTELDGAVATYRECLGMSLVHREVIAEQGVEVALLETGEGHVELLAPLSADTTVGRFLAARGPGLHHVAYRVADIDAALEALSERKVELIDQRPRTGVRDSRIAFIHPRATGGVLTEIVQSA